MRPPVAAGRRPAPQGRKSLIDSGGAGLRPAIFGPERLSPRAARPVNAIELELFRHFLVSIAEEMGVVLRRSSYSANIKERRDYSCAIYDAQGETVAMGDHMPVHLGAMPLSVSAVRAALDLGPGDVALVNDPFRGGTHLPDITAIAPVFTTGPQASFFLANRAHHSDVGGMSPGSMPLAREIYQEGLRIPPVHLVRGGKIDRELLGLVLANVRTPVEREGDLMAQLASLARGAERVNALVTKYGPAKVETNMRALQDYSERMMRAAIRKLADGVYRFEDCLDSDGISPEPVWIRVAIAIRDDSATVDFSGSQPQVQGSVNANYAVTLAAVMYVFRCLIQEDVPFTAGILRPIRVIAPEGTVVNALAPAAMAAGNVETSQRVTDVVLGALAAAARELIPAASSGTMNNLSFGGVHRGAPFAYYETIAGGMGASAHGAGRSATQTHMTNTLNTPVEAFEHQFPVRVESYHVRRGSGGAGRHRGGDGIVRELRFLAPAEVTILSDRRQRGPWGLAGGEPGKPGRNTLVRRGRKTILPGKTRMELREDDLLRIETPGGGGWG
jgi:N-methylhydantoinase B/oxoprolinase/acetone carboxylase alpha subunit